MKVAWQGLTGTRRHIDPSRRERYDRVCHCEDVFSLKGRCDLLQRRSFTFKARIPNQSYRTLRDGTIYRTHPGSSCQATFIWSLRDKRRRIHSRSLFCALFAAIPSYCWIALSSCVGHFETCDGVGNSDTSQPPPSASIKDTALVICKT
jgi:hypothetical protein